jgi:hypothetical protein
MKGAWAAAVVAALWIGGLGCQQNVPPTTALIVTPCPTPILIDGFEQLTYHLTAGGVTFCVTGQGVTLNDPDLSDAGTTYCSTLFRSNLYVTQGNYSLDVNINKGFQYNQTMFQMFGFNPNVWNNMAQLKIDVTVDPSVVAGASWSYLNLAAYSTSSNIYFGTITYDAPTVTAGTQTITWNLWNFNLTSGALLPTDKLDRIYFNYNRSTPGPGQGIGNMYFDNMRLIQTCP